MKKIFFVVLFVGFMIPQAWAQMTLEIIPLHSRPVEEMLPIVRSLLNGEGTVTGMNGQLIVRATPRNLAEIKKVLAQLDSPPRNLLITVKQGLRESLEKEEASVSADVRIGKGRVIVPHGGEGDGVEIGGKSGDSRVGIRAERESGVSNEMSAQRVRALDGRPAVIYIGQSVPFRQERVVKNGTSLFREESMTFKDVNTGFTVLPRLQGDQVIVEVNPTRSTIEGGQIKTQGLSTTVRGRLGEWMELGGIVQENNLENSGIGQHSVSESTDRRSVFIKIEEQ